MQRQLGSSLSLEKLFCTKKGKKALFMFLDKTGIATRKWLMAAGSLEGGNSYQAPTKEILESKKNRNKLQKDRVRR